MIWYLSFLSWPLDDLFDDTESIEAGERLRIREFLGQAFSAESPDACFWRFEMQVEADGPHEAIAQGLELAQGALSQADSTGGLRLVELRREGDPRHVEISGVNYPNFASMNGVCLYPDYSASPTWSCPGDGNVELEELPISSTLRRRLRLWADRYEPTDYNAAPGEEFGDDSVREAFDAEGRSLWRALAEELAPELRVSHKSIRVAITCWHPADLDAAEAFPRPVVGAVGIARGASQ